jgi:lysophospholipase L1-like esterase
MLIPHNWLQLRPALSRLPALAAILAWLLSLVVSSPRHHRWTGIHWETFPVTLAITLPLALIVATILWPGRPRLRLLGLGLLVLLLATELALRIAPPVQDELIRLAPGEGTYSSKLLQPALYGLYQPRPNLHTADGIVHNRLGLRDSRPLLPDGKAVRIVFIGGSTVYGALVHDNRKVFTHQLELLLNRRYGKESFEVINAGVPAASSAESLIQLIFTVSELKPDLVVVQQGLTDVWPRVAGESYSSDFREWRKPWGYPGLWQDSGSAAESISRFLVYHSALAHYLFADRVPGTNILAMINRVNGGELAQLERHPPRYFERNSRYMIQLIRTMGARPMLVGEIIPPPPVHPGGITEVYQRGIPEHNRVLARLAGAEHIPYFDLATALPLTEEIRTHGKFLNAEGQRRKAVLLFGFLEERGIIRSLLAAKKP